MNFRSIRMESGVYIEEALLEVLRETDLINFQRKLCIELQLLRLEHFNHITDDELKSYTGLSQPAIRRLRSAITEKKKKSKKAKGLFSTIGRKEAKEISKVMLTSNALPDPAVDTDKPTTCLIAKDQIKLMERLGEGSFAIVKRAIWTRADSGRTDVAVKILRDATPEVIEDLQHEVNNMQKLQHPNLIRLYGIVFSNPAMMVVEFCDGGSLVDRLRSVEKPTVLVSLLVDYAQQIAKGMAYLESKHCVHRDLAARNVLLTDSERTVKICDFGLMRALEDHQRLYVMSAQKKVPFAWCPPESLRLRQFSHASDVWAFGVTLWEMFSYGEEPWAGCRGAEVLAKTEAGERLPRPQRCSNELYDLMASCWHLKAEERPRFSLLKSLLSDIKFMIAEARETCVPAKDMDLEMRPNDRLIVIDGSGSVWYGQNVRTRNFGHFPRSSIHAKSERSPTITSTSGLMSPMSANTTGVERISKPVPGSFIHAGHGDIIPGQSWGQPQRIDDIYLKNPILRNEDEMRSGSGSRRLGPQIIPSVIDIYPTTVSSAVSGPNPSDERQLAAKKSKPSLPAVGPSVSSLPSLSHTTQYSSGNLSSRSTIDPFSPFSDYDFEFNRSQSSQQFASGTSAFYDQPPSALTYDSTPSTSNAHSPGRSAVEKTNRGLVHNERPSTSTASTTPPPIPPPPIVHPQTGQQGDGPVKNSKIVQYASLPRPMRSSPDLTNTNGRSSGRAPPGSTPPPIRASNFVNQHSLSASTFSTPLGNIDEPPASLSANTSASTCTLNEVNSGASLKHHNSPASTVTGAIARAGNNFRASSYLAATAREVHAAKSRSVEMETTHSSNNSNVMVNPVTPNGEAIVYRETVFGVKPRTQSTETAGRVLPSDSHHDSKNASGQAVVPSSSVGSNSGEVSILSGSISDGPDPFEVSSSVKRIANRSRYSQVFTENAKPIGTTLFGGSQSVAAIPSTVIADSKQPPNNTQAPKSAVDISTSAAFLLPSPSPLLRGQSAAASAKTTPVQPKCGNVMGGQQMTNQMFYLPQQRNLAQRDSASVIEGCARMDAFDTVFPSTSASPCATFGSATGSSFGQTPYSWQLSHPLASIATRRTDIAAMTRPAFLYDANLNNSLRSMHGATLTTMNPSMSVLQPTRLSASSQRISSVNEEILGLFDPLSSTNTSTSGVAVRSGSPTKSTPVDPVDAVLKDAVFAGRRKCAAMLQRCNNDVARAVRELKTDELLAMGIAKDRAQATSALADCRWDLNAAAAALLA
uniref:non-specific protein-tyrosine kinase n=2 Tax=Parascaris univalens TaxID=6257 RepID=A0A915BWW5_PARUN